MKPIFSSSRISFVPVCTSLIPDYLIMVNDVENVQRFIGGIHEPCDYTEAKEISWVNAKLSDNSPVFSMLEQSTGRFIGNIEFTSIQDGKAELGIAITAAMQDKGFGTEAIRELLCYGARRYGLKKVVLRARPWNPRALRVYEKCGFVEYDRNEDHVYMQIDLPTVDNHLP